MTTKKPAEAEQPFDIEKAIPLLRTAVAPFPKAAMFELAERGHTSLFEQLGACLISIRTYDEVSLPTALGLLARARTPEAIRPLSVAEIAGRIRSSSFYENKLRRIHLMAEPRGKDYGGRLPRNPDVLLVTP